jgi:GNAT superfamily N-acetyltransferase
MEEKVDIFKHYGIATIMDHMFLVTHHEYYQQGIGRGLVAATIEIARALNRGEDVTVPVSYESYPWKNKTPPKVQAVIGLFTSPISQKIAQSLGWEEILIVKYDQLFYNGKSYGSRLDENNQATIYMAIRTET